MAKKKDKNTEEPLEKQLWKSADKLRKNIDAAEYKHIVLGHSNGSTVLYLSKNAIPYFEFFLPPRNNIEQFTAQASNFINKKNKNIAQIRTLEKLRDTLLPKLISGEVRATLVAIR